MKMIKNTILFLSAVALGSSHLQAATQYDVELVTAVKKNQPKQVVHYLAQGANINAQFGVKKETPLMFAIHAAAEEAEKSTSVLKGINAIAGGITVGSAGIGGLVLTNKIWLDKGFHKDLSDVVWREDKKLTSRVGRGARAAQNQYNKIFGQPQELSDGEVNEFNEAVSALTYANLAHEMPNNRVRVAVVTAVAVALAAGAGYGLYSFVKGLNTTFIKSIRDFLTSRARTSVIQTLLDDAALNLSVAAAQNQTALDLVHSYMINSKNENVVRAMKEIHRQLLEKTEA